MRAEDATAMAMIISELVQNAVEHGFADRGGTIDVAVDRATGTDGERNSPWSVTDDGVGLPAGFRPVLAGLGTRIVTSLACRPAGSDPLGERAARNPGGVRRAAAPLSR
jgi:two-component sensor histidine kinase